MTSESEPVATVDGEKRVCSKSSCTTVLAPSSEYKYKQCKTHRDAARLGMEKRRKQDNNLPPSMSLQTLLVPIKSRNHREASTSQERYPGKENRSHQIEDDGVNHKRPKSGNVLFTALRLASKQPSFTFAGSFNMNTDVEMDDKDRNKAVAEDVWETTDGPRAAYQLVRTTVLFFDKHHLRSILHKYFSSLRRSFGKLLQLILRVTSLESDQVSKSTSTMVTGTEKYYE
ncbi:hypothetical protein M422DRAFT_265322 [Sphaerobolus stellatus SS14]|uniref:Uncharacterized protein n=1 Tax=Sphaerobolus stellatus (strain SS14) TaxID=990650 RepID=A0A0C9V5S6_SPHS4|nr:hypothetical protein M422DRAFT_265322 [Sphaerobolus stellatus SS14]